MATAKAAAKTAAKKPATRARKTTPKVDAQIPSVQTITITEAQKQAQLEAYHALKSSGLPIPEELKVVEVWVAELQAQRDAEIQALAETQIAHQAQVEAANQNGPWYVRNGYPAPFNLRLDRQTEKRRIELKPRGVPGDLHPLKDEDLQDPVIRQNLSLGLIEIIPAGEAALIIDKQTTNMTQRVHTPLAVLRSEHGKPYEQGAVKVEAEFNSQGVTVATLDPRATQGQLSDKQIQQQAQGMVHARNNQPAGQPQVQPATSVVHSQFIPTGGNQAIIQYGPLGNNTQAKVVDDIARRKDIQGPAAGLGGLSVTVDPVVKN